MPSNKDLKQAIVDEAVSKNATALDTENKSNAELAEILSGLKAMESVAPVPNAEEAAAKEAEEAAAKEAEEAAAKEAEEAAAKEAEEAEAQATAEAAEKPPYYIAEGKSLTCRKGVLVDGNEMKVEYVAGGQKTLDKLVKNGFVIKS